jgi:predicted transcriptional regulator
MVGPALLSRKLMADHEQLLTLATEIVSAHVRHNAVTTDQLPSLIQHVFDTLATVEQKVATPPRPEPAVPIKQSVRPGHIVCLECGKHFSMLKRHVTTDHKLTPEQYRQRWGLPASYPLVAPNYAKVRSALAKKIGLGRRGMTGRKKSGRARA